jgi:hypothetical protein
MLRRISRRGGTWKEIDMAKRKGLAALAACAFLVVGGLFGTTASATEPVVDSNLTASDNSFGIRPLYLADDTGPTKILQSNVGSKVFGDSGITMGGWVEGSYTWNFRRPGNHVNEGRAFDFEHDEFRLNQIELNIGKAIDMAAAAKAGKVDWGFMVDMLYGSDGRLIHSNGLSGKSAQAYPHPINQFDLTQAYVDLFLPVGSGLDIRAGKFVTLFGYETINPTTNPLYSHSYNFGFGIPFTQTGVLGIYNLNDKLSVTAGVTRGWDQSVDDNNGAVDFLGQVKYVASDEFNVLVNASVGPQRFKNNSDYRYAFEVIANYVPKAMTGFTFAADGLFAWEEHAAANGNTARWYGVTGYAGYKINDMITVNGRAEWFRDEGASRLGLDASFFEGTLGLSIHPLTDKIGQNLVIRPEIRGDYSNRAAFNGGRNKSQATIALDAIFAI